MNTLKALSKQVFGARQERIIRSLIVCMILFFAVRTAEMEVEIAQPILFLTAMFFSLGIMWQTLHSSGNADSMAGLFMLPFENGKMTFSLVWAYTGYTLLTKTFPVLALFFAVCRWSILQIAAALCCACNGCLTAAAWYTMIDKHRKRHAEEHFVCFLGCKVISCKRLPFVILWCGAILLSIFWVQETMVFFFLMLASLFASLFSLMKTNAYVFYRPVFVKHLVRHTKGTGNIFLYLLRYLVTNQNYLLNTVCLCVVSGVLPFLLGQFQELPVMPLGFAMLCFNTPICILLSCDPDIEQAVRVLPGQARHFCISYCFFIFSVNMIVNGVYLTSWQIRYGGVDSTGLLAALLLALQGAILSVLLEWFLPVRNWKMENDLWHHPRKYIVPLIMLLLVMLISIWSVSLWILLCMVILECFSLLWITRRI
ncbi:MAG: hypothetical protein NC548_53850 [Lachnospiraceae bacterium]|nr:hypothetical protein [Lachnospiraceae bacterium]